MKVNKIILILCFSFIYSLNCIASEIDSVFYAVSGAQPDDSLQIKQIDTLHRNPVDDFLLDSKDFLYANTQRYTLDGSQPLKKTRIKTVPAIIYGSIYTGIFIIQHEMQQNTIWKQKGEFNIAEDAQYSMYLDKPGHFYGTYLPSYIFGETLLTLGFSDESSALIGGLMGLSYTGYVEILDGFSKGFGFSPTDFMADCAGAGFYIAQHYIPYLQNFTPKFMYVKPSWINQKNRRPADSFIDDYSSQTFWMSVNVHNMLPNSVKDYWPEWLDLSFGYAVYSICAPVTYDEYGRQRPKGCDCDPISEQVSDDAWGNRKFLISLDYNLVKLLPDSYPFFNWLKQSLRNFKMPAPTLEIGKKTKFYFLFPVNFTIG